MAPAKEPSPLTKVIKEADRLKKLVDKAVKEGNKISSSAKLKNDETKVKDAFKICFDLKIQVEDLSKEADVLVVENEAPKFKNFDNKKANEVKRISNWMTQLETAMGKVMPDEEKRNEYLKELKGDEKDDTVEEEEDVEEEEEVEEEEDDEEGEEDEDDEEEEDEEEETTAKDKPIPSTSKTEEEDDEEDDEEEEDDDEDEEEEDEEEEEEKETPVKKKPEAKKKVADDEEDDEEDDDEDDEDDEEDEEEDEDEDEGTGKDTMEVTQPGQQFEALCDYECQEEGDLEFAKGDILTIVETREDGWWVAENVDGKKGTVPSTLLKMHNKYKDVQEDDEKEDEEERDEEKDEEGGEEGQKSTRSGRKLWGSIKKAVQETSVTDVLHALGAVPSGFRPSTLSAKFLEDETHTMKHYLTPKLSSSNLAYRDLFFNPTTGKIRLRPAKVERVIQLVNCRQIPVPGQGLVVQSRHVRVCLFDGQNILSNIHTIKVTSVDKDQRTWNFNSKISDMMDPYLHSDFFIRTNSTQDKIGVLFELCVSYVRQSTQEFGEFSCGWVHLPLVDEGGNVLGNRQLDQYVHGGTPYEKDVEVDPSISRRTSTSGFMSMLSGNKQPRLIVKVSIPKREQKDILETLPDILVGNMSLLPFYSYHRQIMADVIIRDRLDLDSTELVHSPVLTLFPKVADHHDMMKILRESWIKKTKTVKRADSRSLFTPSYLSVMFRDHEFMKKLFKDVVMESIYPLFNISAMPPYCSGNAEIEKEREQEIAKFKQAEIERKTILAVLLSSNVQFSPFDIKEVAFDVIGPHCLPIKTNVPVPS